MDTIITFAKDWQAIIGIILTAAAFYGFLKKPIDKLGDRLDKFGDRLDKFGDRLDRLASRIEEVNSTLAGRIDQLADRLDGKIDHLANRLDGRIDQLANRLDGFSSRLDGFSSRLDGLSSRVDHLFSMITVGGTNGSSSAGPSSAGPASANSSMAKGESPLVLTSFGDEIAKEVNAPDIVKRHADKVELPEDADELDIQNACFKFAFGDFMNVMEPQDRTVVKRAIYKNSSGNPFEVLRLLGILLRNHHLKDRGFEVPVRKTDDAQAPGSPQISA